MNSNHKGKILRPQACWRDLWFYRKAVVLYQLTVAFAERFLPRHGDRTVDQMVQAARSGKQNIVEGSADGVTSTEMELKLLNVARASIQELQEDYADYIGSHELVIWTAEHPRFASMLEFSRNHNDLADYEPYFSTWSDEEMANVGYTLCRLVDKMMTGYLKRLEERFVAEGGIKERMTAARLDYRADLRRQLEQAREEIAALKADNARLAATIERLQAEKRSSISPR